MNRQRTRERTSRRGKLSERISERLGVYAGAAGAACAGVLAAVQPAAAQVIYTPAHTVIGPGSIFELDFANAPGFLFQNQIGRLTVSPYLQLSSISTRGLRNGVDVENSNLHVPPALRRGAKIGRSRAFWPSYRNYSFASALMAGAGKNGKSGNFVNLKDRYLGVKFYVANPFNPHYGWARFTVHVDPNTFELSVLLSGYAYEATPNAPIRAGQMSGTADDPVFAPESDDPESDPGVRSEPEPTSRAIPQALLGLLALGAPGLNIWRPRKRELTTK